MKFKDTAGREWRCICNVHTMSRVRKETGLDLTKTINKDSNVIETIAGDVSVFFEVMLALLHDQMVEQNVSPEEFGAAINDEDVVGEALQALVEGILDFFPADRRGPLKMAFRKVWKLAAAKSNLEAERAIALIESPEFDAMAERAIETGDMQELKTATTKAATTKATTTKGIGNSGDSTAKT